MTIIALMVLLAGLVLTGCGRSFRSAKSFRATELDSLSYFSKYLNKDGIRNAARLGNLAKVKSKLAENPKRVNSGKVEGKNAYYSRRLEGGEYYYYGSPLFWAVLGGHKEVSEFLISKGAHLNFMGSGSDDTVLNAAVIGGSKDIVELLITKGADVNRGFPPALYFAAGCGHEEIVELLVANGADVNLKVNRPSESGTLLHCAATRGHVRVAESLIAHGADLNAKNNKGHTPLDIAVREGHEEVAELLRKAGAE